MFKSLKFKKWTSWVVTTAMTVSILANGAAFRVKAAAGDKLIDIVELTDFHGTLTDASNNQVAAVLANRIKAVKAQNPNTLIISGGDLYQGSAVSNMSHGAPVVQVMNNIGVEVTALGNHEFDWGLQTVLDTAKAANYPIICANLYKKNADGSNGARMFDPYKIITKNGVRIAIIGGITNDTPNIVMPDYVKDFNFTDLATEVNKVAAEIKAAGTADVIIADLHEGNDANNVDTGAIVNIANQLKNVDAVFGGHSHTELHALAPVSNIPIYVAKSNGKGYIDAKMTVSADGKVSFPTPSSSDYVALDNASGYMTSNPTVDPEVKTIVDNALAQVAQVTSVVIGHNTAAALTRNQVVTGTGTGTYGESYLGNWASDVVRKRVGADVGMANNGGLRIDIPTGDITVGTMWQFMPFDNIIYKVPMTKAQLKAILENAFTPQGTKSPVGVQVSGIKFSYDMTNPVGSRVFNLTREDGTPISSTEILTVAAPDFVATGGDGFSAFVNAGGKNASNNTGILVRDALIDDVKAHIGSDPSIVTTMDHRITTGTAPVSSKITIVGTSDVHGNVYPEDYYAGKAANQGLAKVSTYVNGLRDASSNVMLVDNGDTIQGTPLVYYYNMLDTKTVNPMSTVMGAMMYDTWTLGNHEFNYGLTVLNKVIKDSNSFGINMLSANTYNADNTNYVKPYYVKSFNVNGQVKKVAILGLTTKCIPNWEDPAHYAGLHFNDLVDEAKKWVPILKNTEKADVVIVTAHTGEESASDVIPENEAKALATQVSGIDAIVAGHVHNVVNDTTLKNPNGKVVPVVEPGKYGQYVAQLDITFDGSGNPVVATKDVKMDTTPADPFITNTIAKPYEDTTQQYIQTKLGNSTGEFTGVGQTTQPTAIMELINKVQKEAAGTNLSIAAPLSSSAYIPSGNVTIKDIMSVYVFENFLFGVKMTGKQLKDWMEWSVRYYAQTNSASDPVAQDKVLNVPDYNLDQLYGATYAIDLTQPAATADPATGRTVTQGTGRIKNLKVNGKLVKDTDVFTVAINNYRYNGGGGFMKAAGLSNTDTSIVTYDSAKALGDDGQVRSLMMKYIQNHGTISPDCSNNWKASASAVTQEVEVTGVSLNTSEKQSLVVGKEFSLTATVSPANATNKNVTWESSNTNVAQVDENGLVKIVGKGDAVITVQTVDGGFTAQVAVTGLAVNNDSAVIVPVITNASTGTTTPVDITNNAVASKDIFNAIQGQDKTVEFSNGNVTWSFNGKDIDPTLVKDIDLSLKTVSDDLKAKETAKMKAAVGKDVAIAPFSFTYEGKLPGKASVKVFIGKDWANKTINVYRYYADKNTYEVVQSGVAVDADGYMTFTTNHCSDYFVAEQAAVSKLPQTGSAVDFNVLVDFGAIIALLGAALFIANRRRRNNAA